MGATAPTKLQINSGHPLDGCGSAADMRSPCLFPRCPFGDGNEAPMSQSHGINRVGRRPLEVADYFATRSCVHTKRYHSCRDENWIQGKTGQEHHGWFISAAD